MMFLNSGVNYELDRNHGETYKYRALGLLSVSYPSIPPPLPPVATFRHHNPKPRMGRNHPLSRSTLNCGQQSDDSTVSTSRHTPLRR